MAKPTVGRIVHYVSYGTPGGEYGSECRAAIVTEVTRAEVNEENPAGDGIYRDTVGLMVANPTGQFFNRGVLQDEEGRAGGSWHWPEREG
jgi:hypothetical protein